MAHANLEAVTGAIDALYAAAYDCELMPATVERLRQLFDGSKACFMRLGPNLSAADAISTECDPEFNRRYVEEFGHEVNTYSQAFTALPVGTIYSDHALLGAKQLRSSRVWNEWMAPQNMYSGLGCRLFAAGPSSWFFDVQRGRGQAEFDSADVALCKMLAPTLMKVTELRYRMGALTLKKGIERYALDSLTVGIAAVDPHARILYANAAVDCMFERPDGALSSCGGRLLARDPVAQADLKQLIAQTCAGQGQREVSSGYLLARSPDPDGLDVALCVMPVHDAGAYGLPDGQPVAMVVARTLEQDANLEDQAVRLFALTPAEAKFASALASGQSLAEAADAQMVRITTARTHLARIFQKTGTRQQSQVAALLRAAHLPIRNGH
jgi:DNA-binding CsgD family transcriptional regulator